ncbi:unnamed protein product [Brachionus calyciflorus]|uniref:Uncharacterized protein n=1 Tax=Brachionus calyciflorus TaxID=104777 RepID=A0A814L6Y6_9BILA|nr:unnamed protein product [Brachionus calyciflorus]
MLSCPNSFKSRSNRLGFAEVLYNICVSYVEGELKANLLDIFVTDSTKNINTFTKSIGSGEDIYNDSKLNTDTVSNQATSINRQKPSYSKGAPKETNGQNVGKNNFNKNKKNNINNYDVYPNLVNGQPKIEYSNPKQHLDSYG